MRSWIVSLTARDEATHQSLSVALGAYLARVEVRWRRISDLMITACESGFVSLDVRGMRI